MAGKRQYDLAQRTDEEIANQIANYERKDRTDDPLYRALVEERARRFGDVLRPDVSIQHLVEAAKDGRFTTYGAMADANGVTWSEAYRPMSGKGGHLDQLLDICHARGLPLLTAICVNKESIDTGELSPEALRGFVKGARRLRRKVTGEEAFLRECQEKCFAWGRGSG